MPQMKGRTDTSGTAAETRGSVASVMTKLLRVPRPPDQQESSSAAAAGGAAQGAAAGRAAKGPRAARAASSAYGKADPHTLRDNKDNPH